MEESDAASSCNSNLMVNKCHNRQGIASPYLILSLDEVNLDLVIKSTLSRSHGMGAYFVCFYHGLNYCLVISG